MRTSDAFAVGATIAVSAYYFFSWLVLGWRRKSGTIVPLYEPPRQLSPAMLRYVWKESFDDRTFWAGVLSLVAKGLATLHSGGGTALIRATSLSNRDTELPPEEEVLLDELVRGHTRRDVSVNMLSPKTILAVRDMADALRQKAVGQWFTDNRAFVISGAFLSIAALCVVASPRSRDDLATLILGLGVMAPGGFYLFFISRRVWDVIRAIKQHCDWAALRRELLLIAMLVPCIAAIILGGVVLGATFGWQVVATTLFLASLNASFLFWVRTPTQDGRRLLTEIEGFRLFLKSVERLPMQRTEEPSEHAGVYEKYLPYAVALEVEQAWGDRFVALSSTFHQNAGAPGAEAFYLGTWNGKPLEIIYSPQAPRGRAL